MRRILLATCLLVGCARAPDRAPIAPTDPASLAATGPAPLRWSKVRNDARFEFATVDVSIAGRTMPLVVDTGANMHMLVTGLAWYLGVDEHPSERVPVQGAHGEGVSVDVVGGVALRVLHWPAVAPTSFLVDEMPVRSRLMGFLSPQALVGEGAAMIDFRGATMAPAPRSALDAAAVLPGAVRATAQCPRADGVAIFTVDVDIEGHRVPMTLDSGSESTTLFGDTDVGRALAGRARRGGQSSAALDGVEATSDVPDARIAVAGLEARIALTMIDRAPPEHCSGTSVERRSDGALGIDVLRRCVVVIAKSDAVLRCGPG